MSNGNEDIVDLTSILDEIAAERLRQAGRDQAQQTQQQTAEQERLSKLGEFGYTARPPTPGDHWAAPLADYMSNRAAEESAIEKGILANDPFFVENYLPTARPEVKSKYTGVDFTGGAGNDANKIISQLPTEVAEDPYWAQRVIQTLYAEEHDIPRTYDYRVRYDPHVNKLIFNDPLNNNKPTIINPPGMQWADFAALAEPISAEVAGAVAGGALGSLTGTAIGAGGGVLVGETVGTLVWRLMNLQGLKDRGFLPPGYNIVDEAVDEAVNTAAWGLGAIPLFKVAKWAFRISSPGKAFPVDEDEFVAAYEKARVNNPQATTVRPLGSTDPSEIQTVQPPRGASDFNAQQEVAEDVAAVQGGQLLDQTVPQVMLGAADSGVPIKKTDAVGLEQYLRSEAGTDSPAGEYLRQLFARQEEGKTAAVRSIYEREGIPPSLAEAEAGTGARAARGMDFSEAARQALETNPRMQQAEKALTDLANSSDAIFRELGEGGVSAATAGQSIRTTWQLASNRASQAVDTAYDDIAKKSGFGDRRLKPYNYSTLENPVKSIAKIIREQGLPDSTEANRLQGILESISQGNMKSHEVFTRDLSRLRSIINEQRARGRNTDDLVKIRDSMLTIRRNALKQRGHPGAATEFEAAETLYREFQENYKNRLVKNMLALQSVSADKYVQGDRQAYEGFVDFLRSNITRNSDGTLNSPEFIDSVLLDPENTTGLLGLRAGLRNEFMNKVVTEQGGVLKPRSVQAYKNFMDKNGDVIRKFFTEDEIAQFDSAEAFIKSYKQNEIALTKTRDALARSTTLTNIVDLKEKEKVFNLTWGPGKITSTRELFEAVSDSNNQELIDSYKAYIFRDMMEKTQSKGALNEATFNGGKIEQYLDDHGDAMEIWFGTKFRSQLSNIAAKIKPYDDLGPAQLSKEDQFILRSLTSLARAYVGIFTTPGRVMTAVKTIYGGNASRRQLELLSDPDKLYNVIMQDKWQKNPVTRAVVREIGRIFYREEVDTPREKEAGREYTGTEPEQTLHMGIPGWQERQFDEDLGGFNRTFRYGGHVVKNLGMPLKYRMDG